jgi:sugar lactone lactonase YvrE
MSEPVTDVECTIGEAPLWHPDDGWLYWVDNMGQAMYRYDPSSGATEEFHEGDLVAAFTIQCDGSLILFMDDGRVAHWDGGELTMVVDGMEQEAGMRFNDVVAGPCGRIYAGTMSDDDWSVGRLYRLDTDGSITELMDIDLSNGLGFTPDRTGLYVTESDTNTIYEFAYDAETGELSDRTVFNQRDDPGMYDGLTVDASGTVWSALWDHGALVEHAPDGTVRETISMPTLNTTSLTFAGPEFTDAYVTTAAYGTDEHDDIGGELLRVDLETVGLAEFRSRIDV